MTIEIGETHNIITYNGKVEYEPKPLSDLVMQMMLTIYAFIKPLMLMEHVKSGKAAEDYTEHPSPVEEHEYRKLITQQVDKYDDRIPRELLDQASVLIMNMVFDDIQVELAAHTDINHKMFPIVYKDDDVVDTKEEEESTPVVSALVIPSDSIVAVKDEEEEEPVAERRLVIFSPSVVPTDYEERRLVCFSPSVVPTHDSSKMIGKMDNNDDFTACTANVSSSFSDEESLRSPVTETRATFVFDMSFDNGDDFSMNTPPLEDDDNRRFSAPLFGYCDEDIDVPPEEDDDDVSLSSPAAARFSFGYCDEDIDVPPEEDDDDVSLSSPAAARFSPSAFGRNDLDDIDVPPEEDDVESLFSLATASPFSSNNYFSFNDLNMDTTPPQEENLFAAARSMASRAESIDSPPHEEDWEYLNALPMPDSIVLYNSEEHGHDEVVEEEEFVDSDDEEEEEDNFFEDLFTGEEYVQAAEFLGVDAMATKKEIQNKFRKTSAKYHPDRFRTNNGIDMTVEQATEHFKALGNARDGMLEAYDMIHQSWNHYQELNSQTSMLQFMVLLLRFENEPNEFWDQMWHFCTTEMQDAINYKDDQAGTYVHSFFKMEDHRALNERFQNLDDMDKNAMIAILPDEDWLCLKQRMENAQAAPAARPSYEFNFLELD